MNKMITLLFLVLLASCVQQVEPIDENAEPAKLNQILVSEIKTDRAQISWSQDVAGTGYVEYGFTTSYGSISPMQKSNLLDHTIQLANLSADTVYHYKIVSVDKNLNRVLSGDMTFKTAKVEATPAPTPTPSPTPSPVKEAKAPSLIKAVLSGDNYILTLSQAADSLTPAGGYDTFINNQDQNDNASFSGLTRTISGLDKTKEQCFKVEARYTQLTPQVFPSSNEICVAGFVAAPVVKNPVLMKATLSGDNYLLTLSQPAGSILPSGGYDTFINNQDQNDNASFTGLTRTISGLDKTKEQCFKVEARYTQLTPQVFPSSNEICVAGVSAPAPSPDPTPVPNGELKAFPSAEGFGKNATGGRGGRIVEVTTTNFSGRGSLKEALEMKGARTIIFKVGGTIRGIGSEYLQIPSDSGNVTIAGETAPGDGILIRGARFRIRASNVIVRHIRFRQDPSTSTGSNDDALTIDGTGSSTPLKDIIIDHCSFSWGIDGNLDIRNTWGATVQNSIVTGNIKSNLINANSKNISYLKNIFALLDQRVVRANTIAHLDLTYEMINNYVYGVNGPGGPSAGLKVTIENNVSEKSSQFSIRSSNFVELTAPNPLNNEPNKIENSYLYVNGNDLGDSYQNAVSSSASRYLFQEPLYRSTYVTLPTGGLKEMLLAEAGAYANLTQGLDAVDVQVVKHINSKTGRISASGTFPTISNGSPYLDDDNDGMDDEWERDNGLNPNVADNNKYDLDRGYTNLEKFLHYRAGE